MKRRETDEFKEGTVVELKSGGPQMTCMGEVDSFHEGKVHCQWFAGNKVQDGWFPIGSLCVVEDPDKTEKKVT